MEFDEEDDMRRKEVDDEEEEEEEESEPSWEKKSGDGSEDSSDDFRKPVDFGIEKDVSLKLDKLNLTLLVGKDKEKPGREKERDINVFTNKSNNDNNNTMKSSLDTATASSRDMMDSIARNYAKSAVGAQDEGSSLYLRASLTILVSSRI